jgi:hypothetical protein
MNGNPATTKDWTGTKVGKLTIRSRGDFHVTKKGRTTKDRIWNADCGCGGTTTIKTSQIAGTGGSKKSCGCLMGRYDRGVSYAQKRLNTRWKELRQNAKKRGYTVDISKELAIELFKSPCHYCTAPYTEAMPNGIDRAANSENYILGNCLPCCGICNHAKLTMTGDEFFAWIDRVNKHINEPYFVVDTHTFLDVQRGRGPKIVEGTHGCVQSMGVPNMMQDGKTTFQTLSFKSSGQPISTPAEANHGIAMWFDENGVHQAPIIPSNQG